MIVILKKIYRKIRNDFNSLCAVYRRSKVKDLSFTIIANNCWAGVCYEYFNIRKNSPTIGLYFYADEYIIFLENLKYYMNCELHFIDTVKSKHFNDLKMKKQENVIVGMLDDIEIIFLHYSSEKEAKEKWDRRVKRINWDNLIIKFSYMNGCTDELVDRFEKIDYKKKFILVSKEFSQYDNAFILPGLNGEQIKNDTLKFNKYFDLYKFLNE